MINVLEYMSSELGMTPAFLESIIRSAPNRYKVFEIPKRTGGVRVIAQPAKEIKFLQRVALRLFLHKLPVHSAAMAYQNGLSIRDNAFKHKSSSYILKMDFKDFFPSITPADLRRSIACQSAITIDEASLIHLDRLLFWAGHEAGGLRLSIGAPTSPFISNAVMFNFDSVIEDLCRRHNVTYSRYADDLTFSTSEDEVLNRIAAYVRETCATIDWPRLHINAKKTVNVSKKHRRVVTGVVITPEGSLSIGHTRKRQIRARVHAFLKGALSEEQTEKLRGELAFCNAIEPDFLRRLSIKYGEQTILNIMGRPARKPLR